MDTGFLANLNQLLQSHPVWLVAMAFAFALLESLAIVGIFIPGIVLLFIVGTVIGADPVLFFWCWLGAAAGALCGDLVSHWAGSRFRSEIPRLWPLSRRPDMLAAGQDAVLRHGGKAVIIGRFVGPLRPVVPLVAGMMSMPMRAFLAFSIPACVLWAPAYLLPGMLFGASLELAAEFAGRLVVILLVVVLGGWMAVWLTRLVYNFTARRSAWWLKSLIRWSSEHPLLGRVVAPLFEPGKRELLSVALLGLLLLVSLALLLGVLLVAPFATGALGAEQQVAGWAASLRSHAADPVFAALSLAGEMPVMGMVAAIMTLLLLAVRRTNAAWHWLVATAGAWLLAAMLAALMRRLVEAPEAMPSLGEIPHRATVLTTAVLGFFAVMIAKDLPAGLRKWPYLLTSLMLMLVCLANLYLGRVSLGGILAALALGGGWVALVGIGYRQRALPRSRPFLVALVFYGLLVILGGQHAGNHLQSMLEASRLAPTERHLSLSEWLSEGWAALPERRSRIGAAALQRFDLQVAGDLDALAYQLESAGWHRPETEVASPWTRLAEPGDDALAMPHLPREFAGRPEHLVRVLPVGEEQMVVLRLWSSGARVQPGGVPIWLGQVRTVAPARLFGLIRYWTVTEPEGKPADAQLESALSGHVQLTVSEALRLYFEPALSVPSHPAHRPGPAEGSRGLPVD
ncbi:VTT domain-containing protein [Wenzhouxiangella sp. AB-CW3]|uniref:VTT domain-containing protein n=1 Tax=Wenzhouxiangella sp. AB-CW3 TaxID=2771012 RepID=UPI00168B9C91|nr:VTT domain-containing protein [Wenzhouxiangella sp. AB-CW3]QOC22822.1 VTT domain-containing protein [Wenzhouxiangella sp. AB-CW3]